MATHPGRIFASIPSENVIWSVAGLVIFAGDRE
jgi:hypothetical protein